MSSRGSRGCGFRGFHGHRGGARVESSSMGSIPNLETSKTISTPTTKMRYRTLTAGDGALSQAMIQALEKVAWTHSRSGGRGGIIGVAPTLAEYWLEAIERIMTDIDCSPAQKLRDAVSLLRDEAYQWWLIVEQVCGGQLCGGSLTRVYEFGSGRVVYGLVRFDGPPRTEALVAATEIQLYSDCGRRHSDECWKKLSACLCCGLVEHRVRNYPRQPDQVPATAQTLATSSVQPPRVVQQPSRGRGIISRGNSSSRGQRSPSTDAGTFFIHFVPYFDLIDIGSTHLYVASTVSANLGVSIVNTVREVSMISLLGQSTRTFRGSRDCIFS
ncbi:DNA/RNA polymerases superfamily protein [Gossypium australe]|uniref:DNA/RNA polymerases superfamily protein n=1 Tax=Gossypium australe TaxID=47621 RepID=A0A5B6VLX7_9ROSI|nr:DNA/RNA polymerases superfamily protein [Gossypium australe]